MKFTVHLHGFAVLAMTAAILVSTSIGKTMYASVTGWGGGQSLSASYEITTEADRVELHNAPSSSPSHSAPQEISKASPFMQLSLALLLILGGYALEVIRQEHALHQKKMKRF